MYILLSNIKGRKLVFALVHEAKPLKDGFPFNYHGSAVINGVKQYAIQGPWYDPIYIISNHFNINLETKFMDFSKSQEIILSKSIDFTSAYQSGWFADYQTFQIGR